MDVDSSLIESDKKEAQKACAGFDGCCLKHGMEFSITADLDCAVRETIGEIPDGKWQSVVRGKETFLLAETLHAPGGANSRQPLPALPKGWEKFEIKDLRFRLLCRAAKLVRHAGRTVLKLSRGCAHLWIAGITVPGHSCPVGPPLKNSPPAASSPPREIPTAPKGVAVSYGDLAEDWGFSLFLRISPTRHALQISARKRVAGRPGPRAAGDIRLRAS